MQTPNSNGLHPFQAVNPATGALLEGTFFRATSADVDAAMHAAVTAFEAYRRAGKDEKARFLRTIAEEIESGGDAITERASAESGLPLTRLRNELVRTTTQLRLFAGLVGEGSWVQPVIHTGPPDIRKMLVPLGPVVVFGASNFPLAFSVAGGDTASALAAGCPVIVKAHPAHPGTGALVAASIQSAIEKCGMPEGVFSLLFDDGHAVGAALVKHPATKAVAFTGSLKGGLALQKLAAERAIPIPVFAEMGSINPVLLLPAALEKRAAEIALQLAGSITLGGGQFCTKPGLILALRSPSLQTFTTALAAAIRETASVPMLTAGIHQHYHQLSTATAAADGVTLLAEGASASGTVHFPTRARLAQVSARNFLSNPHLQEEVFGPFAMIVVAEDLQELRSAAAALGGQLTVTIIAEPDELPAHEILIQQLADLAGRIVFNGVPTGVEVCAAMQHGGPFPASTDSRFTSVGQGAVARFVRPQAWQNWPDELLPDELKSANPLNIIRITDLTCARK
ncbi:aldehyde dehydrogenase (NADP(+)) [Chitinophaga caseinilytica]|uniref:aldehyde dehydrogenase (NADP(+)) n=1 Tax=Chitinophaga caseinilytica TaxID=2267521 RepID=UPI003C2BA89E